MITLRLGAAAFAAAVAALSSLAVVQTAQPASARPADHARWQIADRDDQRRMRELQAQRRLHDRDHRFIGANTRWNGHTNNGLHNGWNNPHNPHNPHFRANDRNRDRDRDHHRDHDRR